MKGSREGEGSTEQNRREDPFGTQLRINWDSGRGHLLPGPPFQLATKEGRVHIKNLRKPYTLRHWLFLLT